MSKNSPKPTSRKAAERAIQRIGDLILFGVLVRLSAGMAARPLDQDAGDKWINTAGAIWKGFERFCGSRNLKAEDFLVQSSYGLQTFSNKDLPVDQQDPSVVLFDTVIVFAKQANPTENEIERERQTIEGIWKWFLESDTGQKLL